MEPGWHCSSRDAGSGRHDACRACTRSSWARPRSPDRVASGHAGRVGALVIQATTCSKPGAGSNCLAKRAGSSPTLLDQLRMRLPEEAARLHQVAQSFSGSMPIRRAPVTSAATGSFETTTTPEWTRRPEQRTVSFHPDDAVDDRQRGPDRAYDVEDRVRHVVDVENVLGPPVDASRHAAEAVLERERHRDPVVGLELRHRDDHVSVAQDLRHPELPEGLCTGCATAPERPLPR